jgi:uncharacterized membrane protein (TIGR02234 family)
MILLLGAVGAGLAFLASRQSWAEVRTTPPRPLPASTVSVTGAAMVPYADALVVAALASLAAVLATRGVWRRICGLILAAFGVALAASSFTISPAAAIAAAAGAIGPASNPGAGSVTQGNGAASGVPDVAGATPHAALSAVGWQVLVLVGALAMVTAGLLVVSKAASLAVMSSRYDAPSGSGTVAPQPEADSSQAAGRLRADSASVWEALSRGDDPTAGGTMASGA